MQMLAVILKLLTQCFNYQGMIRVGSLSTEILAHMFSI